MKSNNFIQRGFIYGGARGAGHVGLCDIKHIYSKIQMSYPHSMCMVHPFFHFCGYFIDFSIPFHHHLLYNYFVIRDTQSCISGCRIHLQPLWSIVENFPITLKMYFLYSVLFLSSADSTQDIAA